jgi:hypothetical protein
MHTEWKDTPPKPNEFAGIRIIRVPQSKSIHGIITCQSLKGHDTHYAHRRTQPCTGATCPLCLDGNVPRWHGYISIVNPATRHHVVLELTALAATPIHEFATRGNALRGAEITATRLGNRPNSPVEIQISAADIDHANLPPPVNLVAFLEHLWHEKQPTEKPNQTDPTKSNGAAHNGANIGDPILQLARTGRVGRPRGHDDL